jgi:hypothetical protein
LNTIFGPGKGMTVPKALKRFPKWKVSRRDKALIGRLLARRRITVGARFDPGSSTETEGLSTLFLACP